MLARNFKCQKIRLWNMDIYSFKVLFVWIIVTWIYFSDMGKEDIHVTFSAKNMQPADTLEFA